MKSQAVGARQVDAAAVRAGRQIEVLSRKPWTFKVLATAGGYYHLLRWDSAAKDILCDTCLAGHGRSNCWARELALDTLRAEVLRLRSAR